MTFSIIRRDRPINLRCYTNNAAAHRLFPPQKASKKMPDWLRHEGARHNPLKNCFGMRQTFLHGVVLPMWADIDFVVENVNEEKQLRVSSLDKTVLTESVPSSHVQRDGAMLLKLFSPWQIECDSDVPFYMMENLWSNPNRPFHFISGSAEFMCQHSTNMFVYVTMNPLSNGMSSLMAGDCPMILVPKTERAVNVSAYYDPDKHDYLLQSANSLMSHRHHRIRSALRDRGSLTKWILK